MLALENVYRTKDYQIPSLKRECCNILKHKTKLTVFSLRILMSQGASHGGVGSGDDLIWKLIILYKLLFYK